MKKIVHVCILFALMSCSNMSKNLVKQGDFALDGGVYHDRNWNDSLNFKRTSWYHEMIFVFDLNLAKVDSNNPFYAWFSESEKEQIAKCSEFFVALSYLFDSKRISHPMFVAEMQRNGLEPVVIQTFHNNVKLHPDYDRASLSLYKVEGYCRKMGENKQIVIQFPGFNDVVVKQ